MATPKVVKVQNDIKSFSSHPGHGDAAKTVAAFEVAADQTRKFFPAEVQQTKAAHDPTSKKAYP